MFTATSRSHSPKVISSIPLPRKTPASFTRLTSLPKLPTARLTAAVQSPSLRHVQMHVLRLPAGSSDGARGLSPLFVQDIANDHLRAGDCHQPRGFPANAPSGTRDQRNFAIETILF